MPIFLSPQSGGDPIKLDKAILLFGRHPTCDVVLLDSRKVSRMHCCVAQAGERLLIRDLGSTNGIAVNSDRVEEAEIRVGDQVMIGDLEFILHDDQLATPPQSNGTKRQPQPAEPAPTPAAELPGSDLDSAETPVANSEDIESGSDYSIVEEMSEIESNPDYGVKDIPVASLSDSEFDIV